MGRILFITGTGTGVGKTVLTALLLRHLREEGHDALAMKPFCSGSRRDARLLQRLQEGELTLAETNPFFFRQPLAPWVAAKENHEAQIPLRRAVGEIRRLSRRCKILLVEGSGGVLAPLGDRCAGKREQAPALHKGGGLGAALGECYTAADLISLLQCETAIVAPNCLGTINHTLLTAKYIQSIGVQAFKIVMMSGIKPDLSSRSNINAIRALLPGIAVISMPHLGLEASKLAAVKINAKKMKKNLAQVLGDGNLAQFSSKAGGG